ncbi:MAG: enoyl-CoA hydratase-related protein [Chloroflexi bacterium]|nr:enoyl-CoA hydratase-related protein [Chloroflexota bacterium]MCO5203377.1 enoyl-CoA hydratase-related protein [Chloroflexota bacterium]MCZ7578548.1 enoyl-CoA hydratase-related protein [Dehalococcoidia bacterium]
MTDLSFKNIIYEKKDAVAVLTINREQALNAIDAQTSSEMYRAWEDFRDDDNLRVAILTGVGQKSFSTGMDLVATAKGENQFEGGRPVPFGGFTKRMPIYKPIIAAINGFCLAGGMELALTCDIRICSPDARFGLPEVRWAIMPGAGGTQRMPRAIPQAWANYLILTAEQIDAETAMRIGLVSHVVPKDELMDRAWQIANTICERGPLAVRAAKESINRGLDMPLDNGLAFEDLLLGKLMATQDAKEGPRAFAEKRKPDYKGR